MGSRSEPRRRAKRAVVASCFKKYDHFERLRDWMSATDREKAIIISLFPVGNMIFMPEVKDRPLGLVWEELGNKERCWFSNFIITTLFTLELKQKKCEN